MKKLTNILKIGVFIMFVGIFASCNKDVEDPYAAYTPEREAGLIKDWLAAMVTKGNDIDTTDTGIFYINDTTKVGSGPTVITGNTVTVKYTGMFLDGQVFDASAYHDGTYTYKHKTDPLIQGWEEGIEVLNKGASAAFLIPSAKAYGLSGQGSIPPNTPLIFVIEVVDIK
jgi:FKBP-type peptidyl-prolyl cis-trans isomerase